jgi:hypothetical protein
MTAKIWRGGEILNLLPLPRKVSPLKTEYGWDVYVVMEDLKELSHEMDLSFDDMYGY